MSKGESQTRYVLRWLALPYGMWTCDDGREVLFNRLYQPIWQRRVNEPIKIAYRGEWVRGIVKHQYTYNDAVRAQEIKNAQLLFEYFTGHEWCWWEAWHFLPREMVRCRKRLSLKDMHNEDMKKLPWRVGVYACTERMDPIPACVFRADGAK